VSKGKKPKLGAKPGRGKKPGSGDAPKMLKRPVPGADVSSSDATLVWRFSLVDLEGRWGWSDVEVDHAEALVKRCAGWEGMREGELFGKGGNKYIGLNSLCPEAQKRLQVIELDDHDRLWELRLSGKQRIWGIRREHVFYPVWWDPEHTVCG
jgi:hypothetical protein